jgi:hypothetical protein
MIETQQQFTAAVAQVQAYLADPPREGTMQDADLSRLLNELDEYRLTLPETDDHPAVSALAELDRQLADFRARYPERDHSGRLSHFGFGQDLRGDR